MRIKSFDIGVESVTRWDRSDEVHLPVEKTPASAFLPQVRPLDAVLNRPTLDERLPQLLQPTHIDAALLEPAGLAAAREGAFAALAEAAKAEGPGQDALAEAAELIATDLGLYDDVQTALAMLLRG